MKLRHWSKYPIKTLHPVEKLTKEQHTIFPSKPLGLWLSDERKSTHGWKTWCETEDFNLDRLKYEYRVKLKPDAKILYIKTAKELDQFTIDYRDEKSEVNKIIADIGSKFEFKPDTMAIDWQRLAKRYQGIVISPYQWSRRLHAGCSWYYTWDCASGCIWDIEAIDKLELVSQHVVPRKKREINWTAQARKMTKLMVQVEKDRLKNDLKRKTTSA